MEALVFILQRFYWGLGAGCIINVFIITNFKILIDKIALHDELLFLKNIDSFSEQTSILVFITATIIIGVILEGINEVGCQYYAENTESMYKKKEKQNPNAKKIYKNLNIKGKLFFYIFRATTTIEASIMIQKEEKEKEDARRPPNSIYTDLKDPKNGTFVTAVQTLAKRISKEEKSNRVYTFRDLSFMIQLMRSSFLIISLLSFMAIFISIIPMVLSDRMFFIFWYVGSFLASTFLFLLATPIAVYFGKRYVRDVGISYKALNLNSHHAGKPNIS